MHTRKEKIRTTTDNKLVVLSHFNRQNTGTNHTEEFYVQHLLF